MSLAQPVCAPIPQMPAGLSPAQARDPDYFPGFAVAIPLGIQHVLAMFVSNLTPAIIVAGAAGFGFGSPDPGELIYMIQMSMLFAGIATLLQTIGLGPIGARLPLVQGTSFAYISIMIPIVAGKGVAAMATLTTAALFGGLLHTVLSRFVGKIRFALPPLVTGLVVLMIGLSLMRVGVQYSAGGVPAIGTPAYGAGTSWLLAGVVVVVTLGLKFFGRGIWSTASVLIGLLAGYALAMAMGHVSFALVARAGWVMVPSPFHFGFALSASAILGFCLTGFVSSIESIGDVEAICKGNAHRPASDGELIGAVAADGVGTALAAIFGAMPNTTFSQNVGLIAITGVMSRHVVTIGAVLGKIECLVLKNGDEIGEPIHHFLAAAELCRVVEVRHVGQLVGAGKRRYDLLVDLVANVGLSLEGHHVLEGCALGNGDRGEGLAREFVADVFDE